MRKRLIFSEAEEPQKNTASASTVFKELKPNRTALLETTLLTKSDLENFVYLLLTLVASCQDI